MKKTPLHRKIASREYQSRVRKATITLMGGKCVKCGFDDFRALQIDHIKGGGTKDRKEITKLYTKFVMESILNKEDKYQLLCANCNWIKRGENKETRTLINFI